MRPSPIKDDRCPMSGSEQTPSNIRHLSSDICHLGSSPPPFIRLIEHPPARLKLRERLLEPIEIFRRNALRRRCSYGNKGLADLRRLQPPNRRNGDGVS